METSCLENKNVADSFETLIELTYEKVLERRKDNIVYEKMPLEIKKTEDSARSTKRRCCQKK